MPRRIYTALELPRVVGEMGALLAATPWLRTRPTGDGQPVVCLPGFSAGDNTTAILRAFLRHWGYDAHPWGLGQNISPSEVSEYSDVKKQRDLLLDQLALQLKVLVEETGSKVSLIGWSLGGIMARLFASQHPDLVRQVITLGTPFGDPRAVVVYQLMERRRHRPMTDSDFDDWIEMCNAPIGDIPLSIIYSRSDGFVSPYIATKLETTTVENIHIRSSHIGFTVNPRVLSVVADRLSQPTDNWVPFARQGLRELVYQ